MPRIRKKTSKRTNLHQRARIKHKAAETRKKNNRKAKQNTQWKTKHPKDPGIPSNFPYKDQILAEIAAQRKQAVDEKEKRKEEKKAAKAKALEDDQGDSSVVDGAKSSTKDESAVSVQEMDDDEVPTLLNPDYPNIRAILDKADVAIHVIDARDPLSYRSSHLEELVQTKPDQKLMFILNKIDTCPREAVAAWTKYLRTQYPTFIFRSASCFLPNESPPSNKGKEKQHADDALGVDSILGCLAHWAKATTAKGTLTVAVTGTTNAGKSSFVNSLLQKAVCPIYKLSSSTPQSHGTTTIPQEVVMNFSGVEIHFVDTPGLFWHPSSFDDAEDVKKAIRAQDILLRCRGHISKIKDPIPSLQNIVSRATKQDLMLLYNLPAFSDNDPSAFLSGISRSNNLMKKGGDLDLNAAARIVLRDWNSGKFARYTMPPPISPDSTTADVDDVILQLHTADDTVLSGLKSKKDMRRTEGIVKLKHGAVDMRKIDLDSAWVDALRAGQREGKVGDAEDVDDADVDDDDDDDEEDNEADDDEDEEDDEEDEEEDEAPHIRTGKRKYPSQTKIPLRPAKKVAFSKGAQNATRPPLKRAAQATAKKVQMGIHRPNDGEQPYDFGKFF